MRMWFVTALEKNAELAICYTITYAVGNIVLTVWGAVIVAIFVTKTAV